MPYNVPDGRTPVREGDPQPVDVEDLSTPLNLLGVHALGQGGVARVLVTQDEVATLGLARDVVL